MNYRHSYHAGNFSDVFKHVILIALLQSLMRKDTPFCYLETHAGTGCYDLLADTTQKCLEFKNGIEKIFSQKEPPDLIQQYLACVKKINPPDELRYYPGSPFFAKNIARPQDRIVLTELHAEDVQLLKNFFQHDKQVAIHHQDGYVSLKAFLPPKERRGLILIDPPYEKNNELMEIPSRLAQTLKRFETGVYAVWYPIKGRAQNQLFHQALKTSVHRPFLTAELCVYDDDVATRLNGTGMVIINPPWQLDETLKTVLPWLWQILSIEGRGYTHVI